jgi:superoxide dismutase, Cu-Zn family
VRNSSAAIIGAIFATQLVACSDDDDGTDQLPPGSSPATWNATLAGNPGWEHISGSANVNQLIGSSGFTASAAIQGDEPGALRPWHVHFGPCQSGGAIVGADGDYPRLAVGADGMATSTASIARTLNPNAPYHVNVHVSDNELSTLIACGDLNPPGRAPVPEVPPPAEEPPAQPPPSY